MWLVQESTHHAMRDAILAGLSPTSEQQQAYHDRVMAFSGNSEGGASRILKTAGNAAEINITGVMTARPDFLAMLFGGGNITYPEIRSAFAEAQANPDVKEIYMNIDSGGGQVAGLFDTIDAMQSVTKPITARISLAASAAYALASQADKMVATGRASMVGSVGIVATMRKDDSVFEITSTNAPNKRPDPSTEAGQAVIREELDALHEIFVESIADGRGVDAKTVNTTFGQGATLLAKQALEKGMIDEIASQPLSVVQSSNETAAASGTNQQPEAEMDLKTLQAQHPDVYAAAVQVGADEERDRVGAHLTMGKTSGAMDIAIAAITEGKGMTATLQAEYMAAGFNKRDQENRAADNTAANAANNPSAASSAEQQGEHDELQASNGIFAAAARGLHCNFEPEA